MISEKGRDLFRVLTEEVTELCQTKCFSRPIDHTVVLRDRLAIDEHIQVLGRVSHRDVEG